MKRHYSLLSCIALISTTHYMYSMQQNLQTNLNLLQSSINLLVTQSHIDPTVAQNILNASNNLNAQAQANMVTNANDINVATAVSSLLETGDAMLTEANVTLPTALLTNLKHCARINALRTLLLAATSKNESNDPYYTDPYTEAAGFIANDYCVNQLFQALSSTPIGTSLNSFMDNSFNAIFNTPTTPAIVAALLPRITAGIIAHCAWTLEKAYFMQNKSKLRNKKAIN